MKYKIAIIGLGYVGLPLAIEFGRKYSTIGYDIKEKRIKDLNNELDNTGEISKEQFQLSNKLIFTSDLNRIANCNIFIISVPTPISSDNKPNLKFLYNSTSEIASILKKNDIVIYESTVYPGCTEEECVPILEKISGLKFNVDFYCGYSPERINPGDKDKTLINIIKVTSGSNPKTAAIVDKLYNSILNKRTYPVSSMKVAEASKIIENCQRDINIAFVNELSILFNLMDIDTKEVLDAAGSKWNFLPFKPGLVGGHCIGVDPYYLTYKAQQLGYNSKIILSGRKLNDYMPQYVCERISKSLKNKKIKVKKSKILLLGITFKENCTDSRNSKIVDIYNILRNQNATIDVYDPYAIKKEVNKYFNIDLIKFNAIKKNNYDCIIIGVAHKYFKTINVEKYAKKKSLIFDIKGLYGGKYERL